MVDAYRYVVRFDDGSAPNYGGVAVTLAICKPIIRRCADEGDLVIGFESLTVRRRSRAVRWAGIIKEKLTFEAYWRDERFRDKRPDTSIKGDNIYAPDGTALVQVPNPVHGAGNVSRDLSGRFALVFGRAWVFGRNAPDLPEAMNLHFTGSAREGHRRSALSGTQLAEVTSWLDHTYRLLGLPAFADGDGSQRNPGCRLC
ncbi:hypothetical protein [Devosia insulae]|uniref:Nmad2 family putative nucleotide modification protein n=1 Tax=Devosia insulae TaxID=408174 RepID=UPI00159F1317